MLICRECGKKAIGGFSFDIDLPKFGYCKKHENIVWFKLMFALTENKPAKFKYPIRSKKKK